MSALSPEQARALAAGIVRVALVAVRLAPAGLLVASVGAWALPVRTRVPVLLAIALGAAPWLLAAPPPARLAPGLALAVLRELGVGAALAVVLGVPLFALEQGGRLLDAARGAGLATVASTDDGGRPSPLAELLRWTFGVVFLAAGGLRAVVRIVAASLAAVPPDPDARSVARTGAWVEAAARASAVALHASVLLVAAGLLALLAAELLLGLAARLSPPIAQSQIALPLRALAPLAGVALTVGLWTGAAQEFASHALAAAGALAR